jgi:RNA polymerase sigma-70 factor, ECF subfamily
MSESPVPDLTQLLTAWSRGDESAQQKLIPLVYEELHRLAHTYMRRERENHTLQTTALVHEAYARLAHAQGVRWQGRSHFFALAAKVMRRVLVDFARERRNLKRGGGKVLIPLDGFPAAAPEPSLNLVALDSALERLALLNERQSRIVELRYFGGLGEEEIAAFLSVSLRTVQNDWRLARLWLHHELSEGQSDDP